MASQSKMNEHRFCCLNCGRTGIPLGRPESHRREKFHRKKLYCPWCKNTVNHAEVKNDIELYEFQEAFAAGEFQEEAAISMRECAENG